jgi:hypothetical protein
VRGAPRRTGVVAALLTAAMGAVLSDLRRERSVIRSLVRRLLGDRTSSRTGRVARDVQYEIEQSEAVDGEGEDRAPCA